ncbi:MAG: hypothetical protein AAGC55_31255 [Myxococcota bacterium]
MNTNRLEVIASRQHQSRRRDALYVILVAMILLVYAVSLSQARVVTGTSAPEVEMDKISAESVISAWCVDEESGPAAVRSGGASTC